MKIQVSELMVRFLERLGVEYAFGMPGAHILPVYDALYQSSIRTVLAKHEQGAAFMAGGCSRVSGRISCCITTAGPGATNAVTGIANAYADRQPVLLITGETSTHIFGKGGLQESSGEGGAVDQCALFASITHYQKLIERTDYLPNVLNQAARILLSDTPGPVLLSLPFNVQKELVDESVLDQVVTQRPLNGISVRHEEISALTDLLLESRNPVIVAGYGCIRAGGESLVDELSERLDIPVTTSLKGKGVIAEASPRSLGSLGVTSTGYAYRYIVDHADAVLFLGASFNERTSYLWDDELLRGKRIAQVDNDPGQLNKVFHSDVAVNGDIRAVLGGVLSAIGQRGLSPAEIRKSVQPSDSIEVRDAGNSEIFRSGFALAEGFFRQLQEDMPPGLMVFDDNIIFAQNFLNVGEGVRFYPNSGISSLGHAIPAAIGARFAKQAPVMAILGDGGFQMCCMELMTAVNYDLPITVLMFNNATMGLIRKNQFQNYGERYIDCDFVNPDYRQLAASFGLSYQRIENQADVQQVFGAVDFSGGRTLIEIMLDRDAFPNYSSRRH